MEARFSALADALTSDIDARLGGSLSEEVRYTLLRLKDRFRKKFGSSEKELSAKALDDFCILNEYVGTVKPELNRDVLSNAKLFIAMALEKYSRHLDPDLIQVPFVRSHLLDYWRFGPGASHLVNGTHTADKIYEPMTVTMMAEPLIATLRAQQPYMNSFDIVRGTKSIVVEGSKMSTVPKNEKAARTIAIEPSGNMVLQLAVGTYLENVLRNIGLDIKKQQPINKELARRGSITGRLATIDMKSASDMITPALCKLLLPPELYRFLMRIRSPRTMINGKYIDLNMISTMGNGFTFPLMTLILLSLSYAVMLEKGGPFNYIDYNFVSVFGDDIIVPSSIAEDLVEVIKTAGLIVNMDKSYLSGPFRESCGGDFYKGYDCTPFYIKSLKADHDVYVALNQVWRFCGHHNLMLFETLRYLRSLIDGPLLLVPEWHNDTDGVRTTRVARRYKHLSLKQRYVRLKDEHYLTPLAIGGYVTSRGTSPCYIPRTSKTRYVMRRSRLPNGYLDGRCPERYSRWVSSFIESWSFFIE